ncbi:MAG: CHAT domain-containing protein [Desulfobacterales bacterium]
MALSKIVFCIVVLACLVSPAADAQFFSVCRDGSKDDLVLSMVAHSEHAWRLEQKITEYYYNNKKLPAGLREPVIDDVQKFLRNIEEKRSSKAAVLFHAVGSDNRNLCTWLITQDDIIPHVDTAPSKGEIEKKQKVIMTTLGVTRMAKNRAPIPRGAIPVRQEIDHPAVPANEALKQISDLLIPVPIANTLDYGNIGALVIVPIFNFGTLPFAAFEFRNGYLVDRMSVTIAPSFRVFTDDQKLAQQRNLSEPIIVGDPCGDRCYEDAEWIFSPLAGAREEAKAVADKLSTADVLIGLEATKEKVKSMIKVRPHTGLVFIATHGIADEKDPNDKSFLLLSDGRWTAREIYNDAKEAELESGFLAVMSACQTGLGKVFDVGNTGLARAWHSAGASNVIMSLWNVDDNATMLLMTRFVEFAKRKPPDIALQRAMQEIRKNSKYSRPAYWAGFNVFGAP